jgi:hypothetical protein
MPTQKRFGSEIATPNSGTCPTQCLCLASGITPMFTPMGDMAWFMLAVAWHALCYACAHSADLSVHATV